VSHLTSHSTRTQIVQILSRSLVALVIAACLAIAPQAQAQESHAGDLAAAGSPLVLTVDVAEDFTKFNPTFVKPTDTEPKRGSWFITEGNVYAAGTIQGAGETFDPNTGGAIGRWYCRGTHLVSASEIPAAPLWVDTAQLYFLPDDEHSIVTDGLEGSGAILRAVTGGTGQFRGYLGKQRQEFLGFNKTGGVNFRVTFSLERAVNRPFLEEGAQSAAK
jgi:hypothetical protein